MKNAIVRGTILAHAEHFTAKLLGLRVSDDQHVPVVNRVFDDDVRVLCHRFAVIEGVQRVALPHRVRLFIG